jgi:hypothetical protein
MNIIALTGKKETGKTTFAEMLRHEITEDPSKMAMTHSFATPLKKMIEDTGICKHRELFEKKTEFSRMMMQKIGTEIVRRVDPDYWCKVMWNTLKNTFLHEPNFIVIIDDLRFLNEYKMINSLGGMVVRIVRDMKQRKDNHQSETEMDCFAQSAIVYNIGDLKEFQHNCPGIIRDMPLFPTDKSHFKKENTKLWRSSNPRSRFWL